MRFDLIILYLSTFLVNFIYLQNDDGQTFKIEMPGASPKVDDAYFCTTSKIEKHTFLVNFDVRSSMNVAHHILIYGCPTPFFLNMNIWECNGGNICGNNVSPKIIYAWARNASNFSYPQDVGYEVGPSTNISYLVMQIHYLSAMPTDHEDRSFITISHTAKSPLYKAGMYLMMAYGQVIIPKKPVYHVDMACVYNGPVLHPFAFRTHAHSLGRVVSGFVVKKATSPDLQGAVGTTWIKLGIGSPQWPQAFYPTTQNVTIQSGDLLVGRCTYDSSTMDAAVRMGSTHKDEMCNFYLMYYRSSQDQSKVARLPPPSMPPYFDFPSWTEPDTCVDSNVPLPFWGIPFDTDPKELMAVSPSSPTSHPAVQGGMTHHGLDTYPAPGYFNDLSLASNSKPALVPHESLPGTSLYTGPIVGPNRSTPRLRAPWIPGSVKLQDWPLPMVDKSVGQVGSVAIPPTQESTGPVVYVFHRGPIAWDASSFNNEVYQFRDKGPIQSDTVLKLNTTSGQVMFSWGKGIFYMPHGLTIDNSGNMWFTDVALHQVFKYSPLATNGGLPSRLLELGVAFEPGHDSGHFCKPTDVAIMDNGEFFVADGYCNSRIIKFSSEGKYIVEWGQPTTPSQVMPLSDGIMNIPHSLAIARPRDRDLLFVADRENSRVVCLELGQPSSQDRAGSRCPILMTSPAQAGRIYAVAYLDDPSGPGTGSSVSGYLLVLRAGSISPFEEDPLKLSPAILIYALGKEGRRAVQPLAVISLTQMTGQYSLTQAHDMAAQFTADGYLDIYIGNLEPRGKKLWKYSFVDPSFDPKLLTMSKKPSVKKAGVPTPSHVVETVLPAGKGSIQELGSSSNHTRLLDQMNHARNMIMSKSKRLLSSSSLVILLTLGVPIVMTLVIVCLMRKRGRRTNKPILGSAPLNGHATPGSRGRLAQSRNRRYFDDDDDEDDDGDAVRSLASTLRTGGHRKATSARRSLPGYELGSNSRSGRALMSRLVSSVSALSPASWVSRKRSSPSGAAYFNLDAVRSGESSLLPGNRLGGRFGSVFRSSAATPRYNDDDDVTDDDQEEDAVLDLKDYYAAAPNGRSARSKRPTPPDSAKLAAHKSTAGDTATPHVAIKQFSALGDVTSTAPSTLVHYVTTTEAGDVSKRADLGRSNKKLNALNDDDEFEDEIEEFSLHDPRG